MVGSKWMAALAGLLLCVSAQATVIGSVMNGVVVTKTLDTAGVFGVAGADLNGMAFTQTIRFDRATTVDYANDPGSSGTWGTTIAHVSTTINGVTVHYDDAFYVNQHIYAGVSGGYGLVDEFETVAQGIVNGGAGFVVAYQHVISDTAFTGLSLDAGDYYYKMADGALSVFASFSFQDIAKGATTQLYASGRLADIEFNGKLGTDVPEPASLALLGLGLAGVAVARRRKTGA